MGRTDLRSIIYWRSPQERPPQRFYVAFCLLMSSIQDCLIGLKEREFQNLNWSATCSYYSLVHAGRLLTFLPLGDYPTSHSKLRSLLSPTGSAGGGRPAQRHGYPFDWLLDFTRMADAGRQVRQVQAQVPELGELRLLIIQYLEEVGVTDAATRLDGFGNLFQTAGQLRNDSNYEALLIAHEYQHNKLTYAFDKLAEHMANAADSTLLLAIDAFNGFLRSDPDLQENRNVYYNFLYDYLHQRILNAILRKLPRTGSFERKLGELVARIDAQQTNLDYHELERLVSLDIFDDKARLMEDFISKIKSLGAAAGRIGHGAT